MLLASGVGLLSFCIIVLLTRFFLRHRINMEKRLDNISGRTESKKEKHILTAEKKTRKSNLQFFAHLKIIDALDRELSSAGILMKAEEFLIMWIILIFVPAGVVIILWDNMISATSLVIIAVVLPLALVHRFKKKRREEFTVQLGDALITLGNCLRSGLSLTQGIESIGNEMADPLGKEFKRVYKEINYGVSLENALGALKDRVKCEELNLIVSAILIQREIGGNLSAILDSVSETIRDRLKIRAEIKVLTATGRMSGYVVGLLPPAIGVILMLATPDYIKKFFESQTGIGMLIGAGCLEVIGFLIIQKIVSVKY